MFTVKLASKNALVTGAGEGIGREIALALAHAGARVMTNDLNPDRASQTARLINESLGEGRALKWQADVSNKLLAGPMIESFRETFGAIDILVNAAGVEKQGELFNLDEWEWRRIMDVNINGTFFMSQLVGRVMSDQGGGCILNIASTAGHPHPRPASAGYSTSKAAVIAMTKEFSQEFAPDGVRVNALCPANIEGETQHPNPMHIPLRRFGSAQEVAQVALFLCSDGAGFITGQAINVDGGESMP